MSTVEAYQVRLFQEADHGINNYDNTHVGVKALDITAYKKDHWIRGTFAELMGKILGTNVTVDGKVYRVGDCSGREFLKRNHQVVPEKTGDMVHALLVYYKSDTQKLSSEPVIVKTPLWPVNRVKELTLYGIDFASKFSDVKKSEGLLDEARGNKDIAREIIAKLIPDCQIDKVKVGRDRNAITLENNIKNLEEDDRAEFNKLLEPFGLRYESGKIVK